MSTHDCNVFRELIADVEWLDERERAALDGHVAACSSCADELSAVRDLASLFRADAEVALPDALTDRVMSAVTGSPRPARPSVPFPAVAVVVICSWIAAVFALWPEVFDRSAELGDAAGAIVSQLLAWLPGGAWSISSSMETQAVHALVLSLPLVVILTACVFRDSQNERTER